MEEDTRSGLQAARHYSLPVFIFILFKLYANVINTRWTKTKHIKKIIKLLIFNQVLSDFNKYLLTNGFSIHL